MQTGSPVFLYMEQMLLYEILGYAASVLIAVSLMMGSIIKLRVINMAGAAAFCVYGILIGSIPVALMNGFVVAINVFYLTKMLGDKDYFRILMVSPGSEYLNEFLAYYKDEIGAFQPEFDGKAGLQDICIFITRNMVPGGLIIGTPNSNGELWIKLDFVIPDFRDFKISRYVFEKQKALLINKSIKKLVAFASVKAHGTYLEKAGFTKVDETTGLYEMHLSGAVQS